MTNSFIELQVLRFRIYHVNFLDFVVALTAFILKFQFKMIAVSVNGHTDYACIRKGGGKNIQYRGLVLQVLIPISTYGSVSFNADKFLPVFLWI